MCANTACIFKLDRGKLVRNKFETKVVTTKKYKNSDNKTCYVGTTALTSTENLVQ